jgi:hypothetical protein
MPNLASGITGPFQIGQVQKRPGTDQHIGEVLDGPGDKLFGLGRAKSELGHGKSVFAEQLAHFERLVYIIQSQNRDDA